MSGTQYNIIMANGKQLVRYRNGPVVPTNYSRTLTVATLSALLNSRGESWVVQQIADGILFLGKKAKQWWTNRSAGYDPSSMVATQAPVSLGVAVRGNAKLTGDTRIKHREMVATLTEGSYSYRVNPTNNALFPYLSTVANLYDKYKVHGMKVVLVSANATTVGGRWYLAWDTDSGDPPPNSTAEYMAMKHSSSMSSWQSGEMVLPQSQVLFNSLYQDTLKDHGALHMKISGTIDVYIEYDVAFSEAQIGSPIEVLKNNTLGVLTTGFLGETFGQEFLRNASPPSPGKFQLPAGAYEITILLRGVGFAAGSPTAVPVSPNTDAGQFQARTVVSTSYLSLHCVVKSTGPMEIDADVTFASLVSDRCFFTVAPLSVTQAEALLDALLP